MRKLGVQYICDVCGRTLFVEGANEHGHTKARFPLDWTKIRTPKTRYLCSRCTEEYRMVKNRIKEIEGRFDPDPTEPISGDVVSLDPDGFQVE